MTVLPELAVALRRGDPPEALWPILRELEPAVAEPVEVPVLPYEPPTRREILSRAADIIEERGACAGVCEDLGGRVCVMGAIAYAGYELHDPRHPSYRNPRYYGGEPLALAVIYASTVAERSAGALYGRNDDAGWRRARKMGRYLRELAAQA